MTVRYEPEMASLETDYHSVLKTYRLPAETVSTLRCVLGPHATGTLLTALTHNVAHVRWSEAISQATLSFGELARCQRVLARTAKDSISLAQTLNATDFYANGGFRYFFLPAGTHTIQIQFKRGAAALGTARIRRARIEFWELQ